MCNSAHLADNNFTPGIRFYKIDVFVSVFFFRLFFFPTIIVPRMKVVCFVSSCYIFVCVCEFFLFSYISFASMSCFLATN